MIFNTLKILKNHGLQHIPKLDKVVLTKTFHGVPVIMRGASESVREHLVSLCPSGAISTEGGISIDLGRCVFCNECAFVAPDLIHFNNNFRMASTSRQGLIVVEGGDGNIFFDTTMVRDQIKKTFGRALKLRHICAGGDGSTEMELSASMNVNFDFSRYGIDFIASPRHADGVVISGPLTENMAEALQICYDAVSRPKLIILAGTDAISGGLFADSPALDRRFLETHTPDLFIPGSPVHPMAFIDGVMKLLGRKYNR